MTIPRSRPAPRRRSPLVLVLALLLAPWLVLEPSAGADEDLRPAVSTALDRCAAPAPMPALAVPRRPAGPREGSRPAVAAAVDVAAAGRRQQLPARAQALAVAAALAGDLRPGSAERFYRRLGRIDRWESLPPTIAVHRVVGNPDPYAYEGAWQRATTLLAELTGRPETEVTRAVASGGDAPADCVATALSERALPLPPGSAYVVSGGSSDELLLEAPCGTPVLAATAGLVSLTTDDPAGGPWVVTVTGDRGATRYTHVQEPVVDEGATVLVGQRIADVGDLGAVEGCALGLRSETSAGERRETGAFVQWLVSGTRRDTDLEQLAAAVEAPAVTLPPRPRRPRQEPEDVVPPAASAEPTVPTSFRAGSFNVLGSHLTAPGGSRPGFAPGPQRMARGLAKIEASGASVVVLNEFETPAASVVTSDGDWQLHRATPNNRFRGGSTSGNGIAWRSDTWTAVGVGEFTVPWRVTLHMPVVTLQHRDTRARVTVIGVHNPASTAKAGNQSAARAVARRVELAQVAALRGADPSTPVIIAGDFNERSEVYCPFLGSGLLQSSAAPGAGAGGCRTPGHTVDWIFGTRDLTFSGETADRSTLGSISDHPLLTAGVVLPSQSR